MCVAVGKLVVTNRAPVGSRLKMGENDMVTRERERYEKSRGRYRYVRALKGCLVHDNPFNHIKNFIDRIRLTGTDGTI